MDFCGNPRGVIGKIVTWAMNRANSVMYKGVDISEDMVNVATKNNKEAVSNGTAS